MSAEHAAKRVTGVKALAVEIGVKVPSLSKRSDTKIVKSIENTLQWILNLTKKYAECTYCFFAIAKDLFVQQARKNIRTLVKETKSDRPTEGIR
jgi:hypothetical protein